MVGIQEWNVEIRLCNVAVLALHARLTVALAVHTVTCHVHGASRITAAIQTSLCADTHALTM